jgi:protein phosphatase
MAVVAIEQFTLNTFRWFLGSNRDEAQRVLAQFEAALNDADARILEEAEEHPELSGMGTTVTMAFHLGAQLSVVHVGDSRAYIYRGGQLQQVTRDHTLVADMVESGTIRPDQASGHHLRHVITNVVGGREAGVRVEARTIEVRDGDSLLLCSDGLTECVANAAIASVLGTQRDPQAAAQQLLSQAMEAGAPDNVTLVIVRFDAAADDAAADADTQVVTAPIPE